MAYWLEQTCQRSVKDTCRKQDSEITLISVIRQESTSNKMHEQATFVGLNLQGKQRALEIELVLNSGAISALDPLCARVHLCIISLNLSSTPGRIKQQG